jgi:hypothetical protein
MKTADERRRWPDETKGPWEIVLAFVQLPDGSEPCVGVSIRWVDPRRTRTHPIEVSTTLVRSIPIGTLIDERRRSLAESIARKQHVEGWARTRRRGERLASLAPPAEAVEVVRQQLEGRRGKPGRPPTRNAKFYAKVAQVYGEAYVGGQNPTQAVAAAIPLSRSGAGKAVYRARQLGLLGPAPDKGKAGGLALPRNTRSRPRKAKEKK